MRRGADRACAGDEVRAERSNSVCTIRRRTVCRAEDGAAPVSVNGRTNGLSAGGSTDERDCGAAKRYPLRRFRGGGIFVFALAGIAGVGHPAQRQSQRQCKCWQEESSRQCRGIRSRECSCGTGSGWERPYNKSNHAATATPSCQHHGGAGARRTCRGQLSDANVSAGVLSLHDLAAAASPRCDCEDYTIAATIASPATIVEAIV